MAVRRIHVCILEAKDLPPSSSYVKVKVGSHVATTGTGSREEEFEFELDDDDDDGVIQVGVFSEGGNIVGRVAVTIPMAAASNGGRRSVVPPTWHSLRPEDGGGGAKECGKILLGVSLYGRSNASVINPAPLSSLSPCAGERKLAEPANAHLDDKDPSSRTIMENSVSVAEETPPAQVLAGHREKEFIGNDEENLASKSHHNLIELSDTRSPIGSENIGTFSSSNFEEVVTTIQSRDGTEMPENLPGGILLDLTYRIEPKDMNTLIFGPNSQFRTNLAERQGIMGYQEGPWAWKCEDIQCLTRFVTYTKSATALVKEVKAIEEQKYLRGDGKNFAVLTRVSTPDVPYGTCFHVSLLYKIMPGPQLSSGEECCHLVISWNINFNQSTVMKSIIEGTAQKELKESFEAFTDLLVQYTKPVDLSELTLDKDQLLAPLQLEHQSNWKIAVEYLCNFTVISTIFMFFLVLLHILLLRRGRVHGLEFKCLDLPDTFGELITCGILVLRAERVFNMVSHFVKARLRRGSDHGIKAQGDGWVVTVALIEGSNFPVLRSSGFLDPYVVFSCNGQTRMSSVKLQTRNPQWNERMEFDAMQEPPSMLDVQVFNFDGPFDAAIPIAHAEINFVKHTSAQLADIWVPLDGRLTQTSKDCKLHLRIFLDNTKGAEAIPEYLRRIEREVGKKLNLRSPHRNSMFQKLFGLQPDEFLINDFSCALKRRLPLQGRLFLSARIVGFYCNIFGHKTKFFFLWEDIEEIEVISPSFATLGSPALLIILRSGRGHDARHNAKSQDEQGRLRFQFQSFGSFNAASKTIMALWRTRTLSVEQTAKLEEDQVSEMEDDQLDQTGKSETGKSGGDEDSDSLLEVNGTKLSKHFSAKLSIDIELLMHIFSGGQLEKRVMEKVGCLNYLATQWEIVELEDIFRRHVCYKFNRHISIFGGEAQSIQHKGPTSDGKGWIVDELMTLHGLPFADHFHVHMKYRMIKTIVSNSAASQCDFFVGVVWTKKSKFKRRIAKNICDKLAHRSKEIFELAERELLSSSRSQDQVTDKT